MAKKKSSSQAAKAVDKQARTSKTTTRRPKGELDTRESKSVFLPAVQK